MQVELSKQEAHKIMDAIKAYSKDYVVTAPVNKTFCNIIKKLESVINQ